MKWVVYRLGELGFIVEVVADKCHITDRGDLVFSDSLVLSYQPPTWNAVRIFPVGGWDEVRQDGQPVATIASNSVHRCDKCHMDLAEAIAEAEKRMIGDTANLLTVQCPRCKIMAWV